jgi:hypothetical protein
MKINTKDIIYSFILIITFLLLLKNCNNNTTTEVEVPITVEIKVPEYIKVFDTIYQDKIKYRTKTVPNPTDSLLTQYLTDSIDRLNMFISAISVREYTQTFEDTIQKIDIYSKTRGELLEQSVSYNIFPRTYKLDTVLVIKCPIVSQQFINVGPGYNFVTNQPTIQTSYMYINKKSRVYQAGLSSEGNVYVKYGIKF